MGKHRKRITCAVWSIDGLLALASEDRTLTISTSDGDTRREIVLQGEPSGIQFGEMKTDYRAGGENTVRNIFKIIFLKSKLQYENDIKLILLFLFVDFFGRWKIHFVSIQHPRTRQSY